MSKKFKVVTDCGHAVEYDTAYELGFIIGSKNMKMHNPFEPIHSEYEEFNEGRFDGKKRNIDSVSKRESGWYRVRPVFSGRHQLAYWSLGNVWVIISSDCNFYDDDMAEIDEQMVMTPDGQIVYNQPAHDQLRSNLDGVEVSLDVSTCDSDAGNRIFGVVNGFSESKGKLVILAEETSRNFGSPAHDPLYNTKQEG